MFSKMKGGKAEDISEIGAGEMIIFLKRGVEVTWQRQVGRTQSFDGPRKLTGLIPSVNKFTSLF